MNDLLNPAFMDKWYLDGISHLLGDTFIVVNTVSFVPGLFSKNTEGNFEVKVNMFISSY
jgi:hypothetical protein